MQSLSKISNELNLQSIKDRHFISLYNSKFSNFLQKLSPHSRELIRNNKELNEFFDLFLDFILDSSQHLDYASAKEQEKNIDICE